MTRSANWLLTIPSLRSGVAGGGRHPNRAQAMQTHAQTPRGPSGRRDSPRGAADYRPSAERPCGGAATRQAGSTRAADPPTRWSAKKNVFGRAEVGPGHSSPVVVGQRVLVTAEPDVSGLPGRRQAARNSGGRPTGCPTCRPSLNAKGPEAGRALWRRHAHSGQRREIGLGILQHGHRGLP